MIAGRKKHTTVKSTPNTSGSTQAEQYRYDVFISASPADAEWVSNWLVPKLRGAKLEVCTPDECFEPGAPVLEETERAIRESRRTLIVLSPSWVEGEWSNLEALLARSRDPGARWRRVIPLLLTPCEPPDSIQLLHWVDLTDTDHREQQLDRIIAAIQGKSLLPELQLSAFPEAKVRRLELRWYAIAGVVAILTLAVLIGWIYFQYSAQNPTRMPEGAFNVAVADFAVIDDKGNPIPDSNLTPSAKEAKEQVQNLAGFLATEADQVEKILGQPINVWGPEHRIRPVQAGEEETRANDLHADVLIYGTLKQVGDESWSFDPEFYLSHDPLAPADELRGEHRLGAPLPFTAGQIASKKEVNSDLEARVKALTRVILALSSMNSDTVKGYHDAQQELQTAAQEFESTGANEGKGLDVIYLFLGNAFIGESNLEQDAARRKELLAKGIENFNTAIAKNSQYPRAYNGLGSALFQMARPAGQDQCAWDWDTLQKSEDAHTTALHLPPESKPPSGYVDLRAEFGLARAYYYRGYCLNKPDWDTAEDYYHRAQAEYEKTPKKYLWRLGSIVYADAATIALYRSTEASPDQAHTLRLQGIENYIRSRDLALDSKTAGSEEQAISVMPFLLYLYCQDGQKTEAQKALDEFVQKLPDPQAVRTKILAGIKEGCVK